MVWCGVKVKSAQYHYKQSENRDIRQDQQLATFRQLIGQVYNKHI